MKNSRLYIVALFSIVAFQTFSQTTYFVSGYVVDGKNCGIESVYITVKNNDSKKDTLTNQEGFFSLNLDEGSYMLQGIYFGKLLFEKNLDVKADIELGKIEAAPSVDLEEIVVTGEKPLMEMINDKLVFHAQNLGGLAGYKASELLKYVPRVMVSSSGIVTIGNKPATIFVNERQLSSDETAGFLKTINAKDINRIEIKSTYGGTNSADIQGGVINIITKLPQTGFNGTIQTNQAFFGKAYTQWFPGANLFYGADNWNLYASYFYDTGKNKQYSETTDNNYADSISHSLINNYFSHSISNIYKIGAMGIISKAHTLGIELNGTTRVPTNDNSTGSIILSKNNRETDNATSTTSYNFNSDFYNLAANYIWQTDEQGSTLKILANLNNKSSFSSNLIHVKYENDADFNVNENDITTANAENYSLKIDFCKNMPAEWSIRVGSKYLNSSRKSEYIADNFNESLPLPVNWDYKEKILSGYAGLSKTTTKGCSFNVLFRIENTDIKGFSNRENGMVYQNYTNLFPYIYFSSTNEDKLSYSILYTTTIFRPPFSLMNNYANRISDILYDIGNPDLKPEKQHVGEMSLEYGNHSIALSYNFIPNAIAEVFSIKDNITYHTNMNQGAKSTIGLDYSFAGTLMTCWKINAYLFGGYTKIPSSSNKTELFHGIASLNSRLELKKLGFFSLDISGTSGEITGNNFIKGNFTSNFSFRRSLLNDAINIQVEINDIFNTNRVCSETLVPQLNYKFYAKSFTRCFRVNLSYAFSTRKKINNRNLKNDNSIINRF